MKRLGSVGINERTGPGSGSLVVITAFLLGYLVGIAPVDSAPIGYGDCIEDTISSAGEQDTLTFSGDAGDIIIVRMTRISGDLAPHLQVLDPSHTVIGDEWGFWYTTVDTLTLPSTGSYTILAYDYFGAGMGPYGLSLQRTSNPVGATPIAYGDTVQDSIVLVSELDTYTFSGNAGDEVLIKMVRTSGTTSPYLELFEPSGQKITENWGVSQAEVQTLLPNTGSYTVLASDYTGYETGDYDLSLLKVVPGIGERGFRVHGPDEFTLSQNRPNPFRNSTRIHYAVWKDTHAAIEVYDVAGDSVRTLMNGRVAAGHHSVVWDGTVIPESTLRMVSISVGWKWVNPCGPQGWFS